MACCLFKNKQPLILAKCVCTFDLHYHVFSSHLSCLSASCFLLLPSHLKSGVPELSLGARSLILVLYLQNPELCFKAFLTTAELSKTGA